MKKRILLRLGSTFLVLACIITASFFLIRLAPGGPFDAERAISPEIRAQLMRQYGLDQPLHVQYLHYIENLLHFDLGMSMKYPGKSVSGILSEGLPWSAGLGAFALLTALFFGISMAWLGVLMPGRNLDRWLTRISLVCLSLPGIIIAPLSILIFSLWLGLLPAGLLEGPEHLVLPVFALAIPLAARIFLLMRDSIQTQTASTWFKAALGRGITPSTIFLRHVLRHAMAPVAAFLAPASAALLTGSIVIETVFILPGIGRHFIQAALNRDLTLITGTVIVYSAILLFFNLLADLLLMLLDPAKTDLEADP